MPPNKRSMPTLYEGDVSLGESTFHPPMRHRDEKQNLVCPKCSGSMQLKTSKVGRLFYGCAGFPNCKETRDASDTGAPLASNFGDPKPALQPPPRTAWERLMQDDDD